MLKSKKKVTVTGNKGLSLFAVCAVIALAACDKKKEQPPAPVPVSPKPSEEAPAPVQPWWQGKWQAEAQARQIPVLDLPQKDEPAQMESLVLQLSFELDSEAQLSGVLQVAGEHIPLRGQLDVEAEQLRVVSADSQASLQLSGAKKGEAFALQLRFSSYQLWEKQKAQAQSEGKKSAYSANQPGYQAELIAEQVP